MPFLLMIGSIVTGLMGYAMYALVLYIMYMLAMLFKVTKQRDVLKKIIEDGRKKYGDKGMLADVVMTKTLMVIHLSVILLGFLIVHHAPITTTLSAALQAYIVASVLYRHYVITSIVAEMG